MLEAYFRCVDIRLAAGYLAEAFAAADGRMVCVVLGLRRAEYERHGRGEDWGINDEIERII